MPTNANNPGRLTARQTAPEAGAPAGAARPTRAAPRRRRMLWLALLLLLAGAAGWPVARRLLTWDNFGVVEPGWIYRSGQLQPSQLEKLIVRYQIKTIIKTNLPELPLPAMAREQAVCDRHNVKVVRLIMPGDGRGEFTQYDQALTWLRDRRNLPALITCARGTHRTGAVVAAYRVLLQHWPVRAALAEMERYRFDPGGQYGGGGEHPLLAHLRAYFKERTAHEQ